MKFISFIRKKFEKKAPKVGCPKCGTVHDINAECVCPGCGLKYRLPPEYDEYIENLKKSELTENVTDASDENVDTSAEQETDAVLETEKLRKSAKMKTFIRVALFSVAFVLLFLVIILAFFKDKDALIYKTGEYENQPFFYYTEDEILHCAFPNGKTCNIGKGEVSSYISSADGKTVYLTYSGEFVSSEKSNYVLAVTKHGRKVVKIAECSEYAPQIVSGGNNMYLYILTPTESSDTVFTLTLSVDGDDPFTVAEAVREIAVSTSGRYALINLDEDGMSKIMVYNAAKREFTNPGIKNAHPLSIDNRGEYMIYARKNTADSTDIIVEKSTTERVEIPIFRDTELKTVIFSEDRRSFAALYSDKTVFYTCTDKDYTISNTYEGSLFGFDFNESVRFNFISFKEIPEIRNVYGKNLLPYCYYDKDSKFVYRVSDSGMRESVFDPHIIDELRVSDNGRCAFSAAGFLYSGKLYGKDSEVTRIMNFTGMTLIDISPDGKDIYYTDSDGNMFRAQYGRNGSEHEKISVDPQLVRISADGKRIFTVSGTSAVLTDKKGKSVKLNDGIDLEMSRFADDGFTRMFYTVSGTDSYTGEEKKSLYLLKGKNSELIADGVTGIFAPGSVGRTDRSRSFYVDIAKDETKPAEAVTENTTEIPVPTVNVSYED